MDESDFEWHEEKAQANLKKHEVGFEEAATIFNDPMILAMPDVTHSDHEIRYIAIGMSANGRLLVVVFSEQNDKTRLISCRKATKTEIKTYETIK